MLTFNHTPYIRIRPAKCRIDASNPPGRYNDYNNFDEMNVQGFIDAAWPEDEGNDPINEYIFANEEIQFSPDSDYSADADEPDAGFDEDYSADADEPDAGFDEDYSADADEPDADFDEDYSADADEPDAGFDEDYSADADEPDAGFDEDYSADADESDADFDEDYYADADSGQEIGHIHSGLSDYNHNHNDCTEEPINLLNLVPTLYWNYPYIRPGHRVHRQNHYLR